MSWQYRILREDDGDTHSYCIVERYLSPPGKGPDGWCEASVGGWASLEELRSTLELMLTAFADPVLALGDDGNLTELPLAPSPGTEAPAVAP